MWPFDASVFPVDAIRLVQVGAKELVNLVIALSLVVPDITEPVSNKVLVALLQLRCALGAELRTTEAIAPALETLIKTPSSRPANFLPAKVSVLDPNKLTVPSPSLTTEFNLVLAVPIFNSLPNSPLRFAEIRNGPDSREQIREIPVALIDIASTIDIALWTLEKVSITSPTLLIFQSVNWRISWRSGVTFSIATLSGFSALPVAVAVSALAAAAELPASQIFPWLSAAIAVATSSLPESMVFDQRLVPAKSLA